MTDKFRWLFCSEKSVTFLAERRSNQRLQCHKQKTCNENVKVHWFCKHCISVNSSHVSLEVYTEFVLVQIYVCSLLVICVADNSEPELKATLS